jgi:hypothetical protein
VKNKEIKFIICTLDMQYIYLLFDFYLHYMFFPIISNIQYEKRVYTLFHKFLDLIQMVACKNIIILFNFNILFVLFFIFFFIVSFNLLVQQYYQKYQKRYYLNNHQFHQNVMVKNLHYKFIIVL